MARGGSAGSPRALIREVQEETGLHATVGDRARVYSAHMPRSPRDGQLVDAHAIRLVYEGWVPPDSPAALAEDDGVRRHPLSPRQGTHGPQPSEVR